MPLRVVQRIVDAEFVPPDDGGLAALPVLPGVVALLFVARIVLRGVLFVPAGLRSVPVFPAARPAAGRSFYLLALMCSPSSTPVMTILAWSAFAEVFFSISVSVEYL